MHTRRDEVTRARRPWTLLAGVGGLAWALSACSPEPKVEVQVQVQAPPAQTAPAPAQAPVQPPVQQAPAQAVDASTLGEGATTWAQTLEAQGVQWDVSSQVGPNRTLVLTLQPAGFAAVNDRIQTPIPGPVVKAWTDDLNGDQAPELYVVVENGPGRQLLAWSSNKNKSTSDVYVKSLTEYDGPQPYYRGGDEFETVEGSLVWRFPWSDPSKPAVTTKQLQLKLQAGEAGWLLRLDRSLTY